MVALRARSAGGAPRRRQPTFIGALPSLSLCQEILRLPDLLSFGVGVFGQLHELAIVLGCLLAIARSICGTGNSQERAVTVGGLVEASLELAQRGSGLARLKQQFGK